MKLPAVQLDDHLLVREQGINQEAAHLDVGLGAGQPGAVAERQEPVLED
ncbi:MAG TPA: hypothetical protein VMU90_11105 [Solirubrobacteraceae bacterium]|nr:hypothetical protein [Solirubrobacteraceae bacterium]